MLQKIENRRKQYELQMLLHTRTYSDTRKRNSLLKDYWRIILSALLLFGGLILNATDATFFKGEYVPLYGTCLPISP